MVTITTLILLFVYAGLAYLLYDSVIYREKLVFLPINLVGTFLLGLITYYSLIYVDGYDREYWGSYLVSATHEEPWNEYIHQTCTRQVPSGTDSKGNTTYTTETYDCSYVRYHPEEWWSKDNIGQTFSITAGRYQEYVHRWNNEKKIGHHSGYTQSGDVFTTLWDRDEITLVPITTIHKYYNIINISNSVFKFRKISEEEAKKEGLFHYPDGTYQISSVLGYPSNPELENLNAILGSQKQVRVWILVFRDKPQSTGVLQKSYWRGGNKNELVVCIGLAEGKVDWCNVFSWCENDDFLIGCRERIIAQKGKDLDLVTYAKYLREEIPKEWKRKEFKDFQYLKPNPPTWVSIVVIIVMILSSLVAPLFIIFGEE